MLLAMANSGAGAAGPGMARLPLTRADGTALRVLIVEDEQLVALDLAATIEDLGGQPIGPAATAAQALRMAADQKIDVVLMDIRLPDGDGVDAARAIRKRQRTPIIFVTGNTDPATVERVRAFGGAPLVAKPVLVHTLRDAILKICPPVD